MMKIRDPMQLRIIYAMQVQAMSLSAVHMEMRQRKQIQYTDAHDAWQPSQVLTYIPPKPT
jgi:hypothetical protein